MTRMYGADGFSKGDSEDPERCIASVWYKFSEYQCARKRGYGPDGAYCEQHAKQKEEEKKWSQQSIQ